MDKQVKLSLIAIQNILNDTDKVPIRTFRDIRAICDNVLEVLFHEKRVAGAGRAKGVPNKNPRS